MKFVSISQRVCLVAVLAFAPAALAIADTNDHLQQSTKHLSEIEQAARALKNGSEQLKSFSTFSHVSAQAHREQLREMKDVVNLTLRPTLENLAEIQPYLPEWQQDAIDKMFASSAALAVNTNAAIEAKNKSGAVPPLLDQTYMDSISRMSQHADELLKISDAAGDYAEAHLKALEVGLEVPQS